ncbi:MAG: prephenate dehydrogenase/arogenate dehydrogenase family protein [Methylophilaceae bacterium]
MNKICIIGLGLLGGSIGKECISKNLAKQVVGFGRKYESLKKAKQLGLVHEISESFEDLKQADLIIIATPVKQYSSIFKKINPYLSSTTLITDVGSTKKNVLKDASHLLHEHYQKFIGSHPIAGSEKHGPDAAQLGLFKNKNIIITPHEKNTNEDIDFIINFWNSLEGISLIMDAMKHDEIFSTVSHLPHALAMIFMSMLNNKDNKDELLRFAASGFRDFTRIAASSPEMWRDVFIDNKEACLKDLNEFKRQIEKFESIITNEDDLEQYLQHASILRSNWNE